MATGQANKLTGAVGEFLVAAELCRRGLLATPFAGNVPHYDIIASGQSGGHVAVQVKAINRHAWQFDIRKFLDVHMDEDGKRQILGAPQQEPFPELMCVLVVLKKTGQDASSFSNGKSYKIFWSEPIRNIFLSITSSVHGYRVPFTRRLLFQMWSHSRTNGLRFWTECPQRSWRSCRMGRLWNDEAHPAKLLILRRW
jgi:hypothetical protein